MSDQAHERKAYIYCLKDEDGNVRYVGKSFNPRKRLSQHCCDKTRTYRGFWIRSMRNKGILPTLEVIEETIDREEVWVDRERYWIAHYRSLGCDLTNGTEGGENPPPASEEMKANFARTQRNRSGFGKSQYRGVVINPRNGKWITSITNHGKQRNVGTFKSEKMAALAYDCEARKIFVDDSALNFPEVNDYSSIVRERREGMKREGASSRYHGVSWSQTNQDWSVQISLSQKGVQIGHFRDEDDAALAYDTFLRQHPEVDRPLNFPDRSENPQRVTYSKTSLFRGVCWVEGWHAWSAQYRHQGRAFPLGRFALEEDAALAYDYAIRRSGKKNPQINFPDRNENPQRLSVYNTRREYGGRCPYRGVAWHRAQNRWAVRIQKDGKRISIGYYESMEEAARAYDAKAAEIYGSSAVLNFPDTARVDA